MIEERDCLRVTGPLKRTHKHHDWHPFKGLGSDEVDTSVTYHCQGLRAHPDVMIGRKP